MVLAGNEMIKAIAAFWGGNPNKRRPLFFAPRAFTLVEIMVVVMIIGLIAAFGIPNFKKALLKSRERSAMLHLSAINGANEIYKARNGAYLAGAALGLAGINSGLSINIVDDSMAYSYTSGAGETAYTATAAWTGGNNFTARVNEGPLSGSNPCCSAGACQILPSCP